MKIIRLALSTLLIAVAAASHAQEVLVGVDFDTYFNNREFGNETPVAPGLGSESGTTFAARLTPSVGLRWEQKNTLMFGVDMYQNFGEQSDRFLSKVSPIVYYQFLTPKVKAVAGIFTREMTHSSDYSPAFFTDSYKFVNNRFNGVMAQYNSGPSYVEFICDWEGMQSTQTREKFRILSSGRHYLRHFYYGYNLTVLHFAKKKEDPNTHIVDFMLVNPCVGMQFNAYFDFDIKLGLLQTMQRDRGFEEKWRTPRMGEFRFKMSRWGVTLDEQLFVGENIFPFYAGHLLDDGTPLSYGHDLYPGVGYFYTAKNIYSCTTLSYCKWFFKETLGIKGAFLGHYDGRGFGTQQILQVSVRFLKTVYNSKNHKK